jgi:hypothetical protein
VVIGLFEKRRFVRTGKKNGKEERKRRKEKKKGKEERKRRKGKKKHKKNEC